MWTRKLAVLAGVALLGVSLQAPAAAAHNGGPELVRDGHQHATPNSDGMVRPGDPSFYYGWVHKRNPRTITGVDATGRILLATIDGRATTSLGLSIPEAAAVAQALGMKQAVNLDGGGSTTMVTNDQVTCEHPPSAGDRDRPAHRGRVGQAAQHAVGQVRP